MIASSTAASPAHEIIGRAPFGRFHANLLAWAALTQFVEGYEMQLVGYTAPAMGSDLHLSRILLGYILSANNLGFMAGALLLSTLGDRIGRKRMILVGVALFGAFTLALAASSSFEAVLACRFLSGVGLGGAVPNVIALVAEYAPARRRATAVSLVFVAYTLGSAGAGVLASFVMAAHGWRFLFEVGGWVSLALVAGLALRLPESVQFHAARGQGARVDAVMRQFEAGFVWTRSAQTVAVARSPVSGLFAGGRAGMTLLLWLAASCSMVSLHLMTSWLPTLIHEAGVATSQAVLVGSMFHVGGTLANLGVGRLIDRFGPAVVAGLLLLAGPAIVLLGQATVALGVLALAVGVCGFFVAGGQNGLNTLSGTLYPEAMRSTGSGWAYGVGRLGSIAGPILGGVLITMGLPNAMLFPLFAVPIVVAGVAIVILVWARAISRPSRWRADLSTQA